MKILVTGAAGFIGSNLADALLDSGHQVIGIDNFSTGQREFLKLAQQSPDFRLVECDLLDTKSLHAAMEPGIDYVFHLAANADVRFGLQHPTKDTEQNLIATQNLLEAMRAKKISRIAFSSTGSVYGEAKVIPTPEDAPFPIQTSLYGASKLAAEALLSAYAEGYGFEARVYRFVSIMGERYTHGHVFDFIRNLRANPASLTVLGNGKQRKSYLYVKDCVAALLSQMEKPTGKKFEIFNLGTDEFVEVDQSVAIICRELGLSPKIEHTGGERGWVGDNPFIFLDCKKMRATGWKPQFTIEQSVKKTVSYLTENAWILERRA